MKGSLIRAAIIMVKRPKPKMLITSFDMVVFGHPIGNDKR